MLPRPDPRRRPGQRQDRNREARPRAARQHWTSKWPKLNDRTRSSVEAGLYSLLHAFNTGIVRDLLATGTTLTPDKLEERKWWFVNMPITPGDAPAVFVNAAIKLAVQRYILARKAKAGDPLLCLWSDEFQNVANSYDRAFVEACRSHKACLVALTQSATRSTPACTARAASMRRTRC